MAEVGFCWSEVRTLKQLETAARLAGVDESDPDVQRRARELGGRVVTQSELKHLVETPVGEAVTLESITQQQRLEAAAKGEAAGVQRVELGRVALDPSAVDRASLKFDPVAKERRYQRAAAVSAQYAANRSLFERDDALHLAGSQPRDLVKQLELEALGETRTPPGGGARPK